MPDKPVIGVTMGDPAGIGPEIVVKSLQTPHIYEMVKPLVIGDPSVMKEACRLFGKNLSLTIVDPENDEINPDPESMQLFKTSDLDFADVKPGNPDSACGKAVLASIENAVRLALQGWLSGITTAPINKDSLINAGCPFPGHTELLAAITGAHEVAMMLAGDKLRIILVTTHHAIKDIPGLLSQGLIAEKIMIAHKELQNFLEAPPRIAVAALNPHAGESGRFGKEEDEIISPAIEHCQKLGASVSGPFPPDAVFREAYEGKFDVVISMYHDQGLIPLKLVHFWDGVNITLGLKFPRTSVDHGTGYDIAWQGVARPDSMIKALEWAGRLAVRNSDEG